MHSWLHVTYLLDRCSWWVIAVQMDNERWQSSVVRPQPLPTFGGPSIMGTLAPSSSRSLEDDLRFLQAKLSQLRKDLGEEVSDKSMVKSWESMSSGLLLICITGVPGREQRKVFHQLEVDHGDLLDILAEQVRLHFVFELVSVRLCSQLLLYIVILSWTGISAQCDAG